MFNTAPSLAICRVFIRPLLKTTVLGAVATGSIKAQLALSVAGIISKRGSISALRAVAARMGMSMAVVAVLLVASVIKVTHSAIIAIIAMMPNVVTLDSCAPN